MPVPIILTALADYFPVQHFTVVAFGVFVLAVIRAYCQGRTTDRERDLHARVILLTVRS